MNDEFDTLVHDVFYSLMESRPDFGTVFGLHQYDKEMPSGTRKSHLAFIKSLEGYIPQFQAFEKGNLSEDRQIDRDLMISILKYHLFVEGEVRQWEKDPDISQFIGSAIFPLFSREFAPFEERLESITTRLNKCPQFIEEFKSRIGTPVKLWLDMSLEGCSTIPLFFQIIALAAKEQGVSTDGLDEASAKTTDAITAYTEWLGTLSCQGEAILGREQFEKLLSVRELGLTADEILKIGKEYLTREKAKLTKLASQIDPSSTVEEVRTVLRKEHPLTFEETLKEYTKAMNNMRDVVREKEFASIPEGERLTIMETPVFMRHIVPLAAYSPPARFEKDQVGNYFVTPVEGDSLAEHNYTSIINTSVHEAYPGHHLQLSWANKNPSLVRAVSEAPEFVEGWAHYCEERIHNYGLKGTKLQFVQTIDVIFRAVRIIIDVNLHCGKMTFDEAVSFLEKETGLEHQTALAEVKRYTKTPGYALSYLLGKHLLLQLQKEVQGHLKEKYQEKAFHDTLLQAGNLPFTYLRRELKSKGML